MAKQTKRKKRTVAPDGAAYVKATFNNVMITLTDSQGNTIAWSSSGKRGFRGSRKNTPYAAQVSSSEAAREAHDMGLRRVDVFVKGPGSGRESAIRAIATAGIEIKTIRDTTPFPITVAARQSGAVFE